MYKRYIKRSLDFLFALILMPFLVIIIAICGMFIKLEDGGPMFYVSKRLGKNRNTFKMYKLRSMKVNAADIRNKDGSTFNAKNDSRLTKIGSFIRKTSLDEIPQIINVLKGNMSFIGPRPDLPEAVNYYTGNQITKLDVRPGLTGYSQAYYRNSISSSVKFDNDVYYINNLSFIFDLRILIKTIEIVMKRKDVFVESEEVKGK